MNQINQLSTFDDSLSVFAIASATDQIDNQDLGFQQITSAANLKTRQGKSLSIPLVYSTSTADKTLSGIGIRLHYNSSSLVYKDVTNLFSENIFGSVSDAADTNNFDQDTTTDRFVQLQYVDVAGNWTNQTLPVKLGDFNFTAQTGFNGTQLNVTSPEGTLATGYGLKADPLLVTKNPWNLDIDGDGKVSLFSDGIFILRYLFGLPVYPPGTVFPLIVSDTRDMTCMHAYLQEGVTNKYLDIDGNGSVGALSDGIMAVRYMFGSAFSGSALTAGAIAPDATRDLAGIQSYMSGLTTLT